MSIGKTILFIHQFLTESKFKNSHIMHTEPFDCNYQQELFLSNFGNNINGLEKAFGVRVIRSKSTIQINWNKYSIFYIVSYITSTRIETKNTKLLN